MYVCAKCGRNVIRPTWIANEILNQALGPRVYRTNQWNEKMIMPFYTETPFDASTHAAFLIGIEDLGEL